MGWLKEEWEEKSKEVREKYIQDPLKVYKQAYYQRRGRMRDWEMRSGKILSELLDIKSVVDFGCGWGSYLEGTLQGKTTKILGIDIGYDLIKEYIPKWIPEYMRDLIIKGNIGKPIDCGKWDCAMSIEAAEHLLPEEESTFVDNMINASSRLIILSAAYSYNYYHLNPGQKKEDWAEKFTDKGCIELFNKEKIVCEALTGHCKSHIIRKLTILSVENI